MIPKMHSSFIDNAIDTLKQDNRILGVAVGGSYIYKEMDEYSDIDLVIAVEANYYEVVMKERFEIINRLGKVLSAFTGEHVGEPRLVICLYGPPLLHIDFKFVSIEDIEERVEDPVILWERDAAISNRLKLKQAKFPVPELQWIEDRFWVWIHYSAVKIGRGEIFEAIEAISFIRQRAVGPLLLMKNGKLPRGVRKIEFDAPKELPILKNTIPAYDAQSCVEALSALIELYIAVREHHAAEGFIKRTEAELYSQEFLCEILEKVKHR